MRQDLQVRLEDLHSLRRIERVPAFRPDKQNGIGMKRVQSACRIEKLLPPGTESGREVDFMPFAPEILREEIHCHIAQKRKPHISTTPLLMPLDRLMSAADAERPAPNAASRVLKWRTPLESSGKAPDARVSGTEHEPGFA